VNAHGTECGVLAAQKRMMVSKETMQALQLCASGGACATTSWAKP
jgi:hypothetical protein